MSALAWVAFLAAAAVAAPARYLLDAAVSERLKGAFPWGTVLVNVTGSLLLGFVTGLALAHGLGRTPRIVLGAGFCGTYTTFSTFGLETVRLVEGGAFNEALRNALGTLAAGGIAAAGLAIAGAF